MMNEELVMKMAQPSIKNGILTYALFDRIYGMLSLREQYQVCEILNKNSIQLVDDYENEDSTLSPVELVETEDEAQEIEDNEDNALFDASIFKDSHSAEGYVFYAKEVKQSNETLIRLIQEGNKQARQDICVKNESLVKKYAKIYYRYFGNDLEYDDLMQAGFIGLLTAADRFDFSKDSAFSTYAVFWIKQAIHRQVVDQGYRIRIPVHMMDKIARMSRLDNQYGSIGMDYHKRVLTIAQDMAINDHLIHGALSSVLDEILSTLKPREERILRMRYGFYDGRPRTLEEIGQEFHLTRERIRQIEEKALRKLRHPTRTKKVKDFIKD